MSGAQRAARVLVVEDDAGAAALLARSHLAAAGFEPVFARSGEAALHALEHDPPDAVLLDLELPILDGWYLLARLGMCTPRPRVVVRTADVGLDGGRRARDLGADAVLDRRGEYEAVVEALRALLAETR